MILDLRPMRLGEILDKTFRIYRSRYSCFVIIAAIALTCAAFLPAILPAQQSTPASNPTSAPPVTTDHPTGHFQDVSLDEYRHHLMALITLTQACAKARNLKACDPTLVGPDDHVPVNSAPDALGRGLAERRIIRYGWLRILFSRAEEPDKAQEAPKTKSEQSDPAHTAPPRTTSQLLEDAQTRLAQDLDQAGADSTPLPQHTAERNTLNQVLTGREFRNLKQPDSRDSLLERFGNWLNHVFSNVDKLRAKSAWIGKALIWGFVLAVGVTLAWFLLRLERRWRVRLVPESDGPNPGAASARDWQLWLEDARRAAAAGLWREAIHFVYWASISRLESRRLWPADRTRTPREYLALVALDDPRQPRLASLTRSFEHTWYGGRAAAESDYRRAEDLANDLISGSTLSGSSVNPRAHAPAESGAR